MGRPPEPGRKARTLAAAAEYALTHGLTGMSLRPLAQALGTSTRMLLYDFGSKEKLVVAILGEIRQREAELLAAAIQDTAPTPSELLHGIWEWISAAEREPFLRLFFEVYIDAMTHPDAYAGQGRAMVTDWIDEFAAAFRNSASPTAGDSGRERASVIVATVRGLLLDRLITADIQRTDAAFEQFAALLAQQENDREH